MDTANPKQSIVEKIKSSTNILVTVSHDPSVDELAAALGFTLMLSKMNKHATAVFSGAVPPAIQFLEPEKIFEQTVDSLRDFIIALDKEKADRLRYKVENDMVRIFITPYKTTISERDLEFSQGDFNVELIISLGVEKQGDLDKAISAHGRILHDATVVTINTHPVKSSIGTLDWSDDSVSSLCEMLMSLSEALQPGLLDEQIATSLLTGIVAATDRFSNNHTTPRVMTMAAQLMAAGANQQLIAEKLQQGGESLQPDDTSPHAPASAAAPKRDGEMHVDHEDTAVDVANDLASEAESDRVGQQVAAEQAIDNAINSSTREATPSLDDLQQDLAAASKDIDEAAAQPIAKDWRNTVPVPAATEPSMGGTLNATTSEAEAARRQEELAARNRTILTHDGPTPIEDSPVPQAEAAAPVPTSDMTAASAPVATGPMPTRGKTLEPVTMQSISNGAPLDPILALPVVETDTSIPLTNTDSPTVNASTAADDLASVRAAVDDALGGVIDQSIVPASPAQPPLDSPATPTSMDAPMVAASDTNQLPPLPPLPPMPDFTTLPPLPPVLPEGDPAGLSVPHPGAGAMEEPFAASAPSAAPGQFQIPS